MSAGEIGEAAGTTFVSAAYSLKFLKGKGNACY